jgi:hypothetical protein
VLPGLGDVLGDLGQEIENLNAIYSDAYGSHTEADLIIAARRAFLEYDREEDEDAKRPTR